MARLELMWSFGSAMRELGILVYVGRALQLLSLGSTIGPKSMQHFGWLPRDLVGIL
jgi:hypothetical protein